MHRRRVSRHPAIRNRSHHPLSQVHRIWSCHACWPPPSQHLESDPIHFGNPRDSIQKHPALERFHAGCP
jgi:hypothetical protein